MEKTLVLIKPDGVRRGLVGEIIGRYERKGYKLCGAKLLSPKKEMLEVHYSQHKGRDYFEELIDYMSLKPLMALIIQGDNAIEVIRRMHGHKNPLQALPGTIRGDYASNITENIVHASDNKSSADREIKLWFPE